MHGERRANSSAEVDGEEAIDEKQKADAGRHRSSSHIFVTVVWQTVQLAHNRWHLLEGLAKKQRLRRAFQPFDTPGRAVAHSFGINVSMWSRVLKKCNHQTSLLLFIIGQHKVPLCQPSQVQRKELLWGNFAHLWPNRFAATFSGTTDSRDWNPERRRVSSLSQLKSGAIQVDSQEKTNQFWREKNHLSLSQEKYKPKAMMIIIPHRWCSLSREALVM